MNKNYHTLNEVPNFIQVTPTAIKIWLFICGALTSYDITIIGRVALSEILVFLSLPILFLTRKIRFVNKNFIVCSTILVTMVIATLVADQINGFYFELTARAVARIIFMFGFMVFFILVLERAPQSFVWFIYGLVVAGLINYFRPSSFESESAQDASSYGGVVFRVEPFIYATTVAICTWAWLKNRLIAIIALTVAIISLVALGSSRSSMLVYMSGLCILAALLFINSTGRTRFSLSRNRLIGLGLSGVVALSMSYFGYITLAPSGTLGEEQRTKFEEQSATTLGVSPLGFVLGGRPQVYGAILGITDRPILGFGSWRHDLTGVYVIDAIADVGSDPKVMDAINRTGMMSGAGHSVLFQTWVENGIVPAICWCMLAFIFIKVFLFNFKNNTVYTAFFILSSASFTWTFFFSPPPVSLRYLCGIYLAYYIVFMDKKRPLRSANDLC